MKRVKVLERSDGINFYDKLHTDTSNYNQMLLLCESRLKLHRRIESCRDSLLSIEINDFDDQNDDTFSHFLCRLMCAQGEYSKNWFVNAEVGLFKIKLKHLDDTVIEKYFRTQFFEKITNVFGDKIEVHSRYDPKMKNEMIVTDTLMIYFTKVIDLVACRKVEISAGYCSVTSETISSIMINYFREYLDLKMSALCEHFRSNPDERFMKLHERIFATPKTTVSATISTTLEFLPPCMAGIIKKLRDLRHLKYNDRQTLTLFLKESGVSVEETTAFLQSHFRVAKDIFNKEYMYNIRHNYGMEGKRANYPCFSCRKIGSMVVDGNSYGCPFRSNIKDVREYATKHSIDVPELEDLVAAREYQGGCTLILSKLIKTNNVETVNSPIDFYKQWRSQSTEKN